MASRCKAIASTGKKKVVFTAIVSMLITAAFMLMDYENSPHVWAHRALVAAEESHMENILSDYIEDELEVREYKIRIKAEQDELKLLESEDGAE